MLITYEPSYAEDSSPMYKPTLNAPPSDWHGFTDTTEHWAKAYTDILSFSGVVSGKSNDVFMPDAPVTRAEFSKMLSLAFNITTEADLQLFEDISRSDWHYRYVTALYLSEIVSGVGYRYFFPDASLSRQEAAVMMIRLYEKATSHYAPTGGIVYTDKENISDWATDSIGKISALQIMNGNPDGTFAPSKSLTRAEAAALICRLSENLRKGRDM